MAVTLDEMIIRVAELIKDVNHEEYTERLIRDRIKSKLQIHVTSLSLLKKSVFIPFRSGIDTYPLNPDFYSLISMKLKNHRGKILLNSSYQDEQYKGNLNYGSAARGRTGNPNVFFTDEVKYGYIKIAPIPVFDEPEPDDVTTTSGTGAIPTLFETGVISPSAGESGLGISFDNGIYLWYNRKVNLPELTAKSNPLDSELTDDSMLDDFEWWPAAEILLTSEDPQDLAKATRYYQLYKTHKKTKKKIKNSFKIPTTLQAT